ncbi:MAG: SRPBCC domain-containing protein [Gammaproteobacteria bacterium]|nr:SRPBCC domain-containing protein [Gammaproteobacteria bacterium]MDH5802234.1 SRPBCC domain-containing protein [Gammaproteobacteria bacterium]
MKSFSTTIKITAPTEKVWGILTNITEWSHWNTTIENIEGSVSNGSKVTVRAKAIPERAFSLTVSDFIPNESMVWSGGIPLGLFTGKRTYTIARDDNNATIFSMTETFTGLLAPLITRSIPDLQPTFDEFSNCLKQRAESADV